MSSLERGIIRAMADRWAGSPCSLNGKPAKIVGRKLEFGLVSPLDPELPEVEFSWPTIGRIMQREHKPREFKS